MNGVLLERIGFDVDQDQKLDEQRVQCEGDWKRCCRTYFEKIRLHHVGLSPGPLRFDLAGVQSLFITGDVHFMRVDEEFNELDTPLIRGIVHVGHSEKTPMANPVSRRSRVYLVRCPLLVKENKSRLGNDSKFFNCIVERSRSVSAAKSF